VPRSSGVAIHASQRAESVLETLRFFGQGTWVPSDTIQLRVWGKVTEVSRMCLYRAIMFLRRQGNVIESGRHQYRLVKRMEVATPTTFHLNRCRCHGCNKNCSQRRSFCDDHWDELPIDLSEDITFTYRKRKADRTDETILAHEQAIFRAREFLEAF